MSSELARRVAFAIVAAPVAVAVVAVGGLPLALLLAAVAGIGAWELFRMAAVQGIRPLAPAGIALAAAFPLLAHARRLALDADFATAVRLDPLSLALATVGGRVGVDPAAAVTALTLVLLAMLASSIWSRGVEGRPLAAVAITAFGAFYTGVTLSFGYAIRYHPYAVGGIAGAALLVLPVLLTWASDVGAYFVGRAVGRRKLIPAVSPGKTVEGAVGGLLLAVVVSVLYVRLLLVPFAQLGMRPSSAVLFGAAVSVAAQLGDLAESLLKRDAGVKDSSHLIPGHGGVLDRCDSLFFVLPVAWVLLSALLLPAVG